MMNLCDWYDRRIVVQLKGDARTFDTRIVWVHDLTPNTLFEDGVEYVSHIGPELKYISDVFIRNPLPDYFHSISPRCLLLDVSTGEWFAQTSGGKRLHILVRTLLST